MKLSQAERTALLEAHDNRCDGCGASGVRLEAHHTDYSRKPDVLVCKKCHAAIHVETDIHAPLGYYGALVSDIPAATLEAIQWEAARYNNTRSAHMVFLLNQQAQRIRKLMAREAGKDAPQ